MVAGKGGWGYWVLLAGAEFLFGPKMIPAVTMRKLSAF